MTGTRSLLPRLNRWLLGLLPLLLLQLGCGSSGVSLSGTVTYEDQKIAKGFISLVSIDGQGTNMGAPIVNGRYSFTGLEPGKKRVEITAEPEMQPAAKTMDEAIKAGGKPVLPPIPANAVGNNQTVEVTAEKSQTLDFPLQPPKKAR